MKKTFVFFTIVFFLSSLIACQAEETTQPEPIEKPIEEPVLDDPTDKPSEESAEETKVGELVWIKEITLENRKKFSDSAYYGWQITFDEENKEIEVVIEIKNEETTKIEGIVAAFLKAEEFEVIYEIPVPGRLDPGKTYRYKTIIADDFIEEFIEDYRFTIIAATTLPY